MEKITSGLPPSLYHYTTHHTITPHPQNTQTLITHSLFFLSLSPFIYIHKRSVLLYIYYIVFCHYPFSLSSPSYAPFYHLTRVSTLSYSDRWCLNFGPFHQDHFTY